MQKLFALKKIQLSLIVLLFFIAAVSLFGQSSQSSMPQEDTNFLQITNDTGRGSMDGINVIFFEIPDTFTANLYFAIYDPGVDDNNGDGDLDDDAGIATTTHYLIGGANALSHPNSQKWYYTGVNISANEHLTGTPYGQLYYGEDEDAQNSWVYFAGVSPSQGEHIGNKYYFKIVSVMSGSNTDKNAYRLDVSYAQTTSPSTISGARSFGYSWNVCFRDNGGNTWSTYPYLPDGASGNLIVSSLDIDVTAGNETIGTVYNKSNAEPPGTGSALTIDSTASDLVSNDPFAIALDEDDGLWYVSYVEEDASSSPNTTELWFWTDAAAVDTDDVTTGTPVYPPTQNSALRIYSSHFVTMVPDHVTINATDGTALVNGTEQLTLQLVDVNGDPSFYSRYVWVELTSASGNPRITAASSSPTALPAQNALIYTDSNGMATITITHDQPEDVTVNLYTNDTALPNPPSPPPYDANLLGTNESATVSFQANPAPVMSSAANTTFTEGSSQTLPNITITDSGTADITAANDIRIQIPSGLNAVFNTGSSVTLQITGTGTGRVNGSTNWTGTLTYEDTNHRAVINVTTNFAVGDILTISGLALTAANSDSTGSMTMSYSGAGGPYVVTDDKIITILDSNTTYTWTGNNGTAWNNNLNWSPNTNFPDTLTENAVIPSAPSNQPNINGGAALLINNLTIASGASVTISPTYSLTVNGTLSNDGNILVIGSGNLALTNGNDTYSGTVTYSGNGNILDFGAIDYYNLVMNGAGTRTQTTAIEVAGNFIITAGTYNAAGQNITVSGNWTNDDTFTHGNNTVTFN
ncbi:MAG: hypothetical protein JW904_04065, partial [Spirochaetales bacterium]|nr:hypothetical protein [Spirochaetales bacterium]